MAATKHKDTIDKGISLSFSNRRRLSHERALCGNAGRLPLQRLPTHCGPGAECLLGDLLHHLTSSYFLKWRRKNPSIRLPN